MKTIEALEVAKAQILHIEEYRKRPDLDDEPKPLMSTEGTIAMINMAIADNTEQQLITRLYNLVNVLETTFSTYELSKAEFRKRFEEARELLNKLIQ